MAKEDQWNFQDSDPLNKGTWEEEPGVSELSIYKGPGVVVEDVTRSAKLIPVPDGSKTISKSHKRIADRKMLHELSADLIDLLYEGYIEGTLPKFVFKWGDKFTPFNYTFDRLLTLLREGTIIAW